MGGLRTNGWLIAGIAAALGAGACRTVRLRAPVDLAAYASGAPLTHEIATPPAIVRLRVPGDWGAESPKMNPGIIDDGPVYERDAFELPIPEIIFWHPKFDYEGAIYYEGAAGGMDIERIRKHEVRDGLAQNVDDPSLSRTRLDGRDAFVISGSYDLWHTNFSSRHDPRNTIHRGDIVMAIIPLRNWGTNIVAIVVSRPGLLSRDPAPALAILNTFRIREPRPVDYR